MATTAPLAASPERDPKASTSLTTLFRFFSCRSFCDPDPIGLIAALKNGLPPRPVTQIPGHGLLKPALEGVGSAPTKLALDLRWIDRIAAIVARPVGHIGDEISARFPSHVPQCHRADRRSLDHGLVIGARCGHRSGSTRRACRALARCKARAHGPRHAASRAR